MNAHELGQSMSLWTVVPFAGLLLSIALLPLRAPHFWENHKNKALVAFLWSLPIAVYFLFQAPHELVLSMKDYSSFLLLLTALFIISGGIVLKGDLKATPEVNTLFLLVGAVLANFIGTTGASMLLIRPLLQTNSERRHTIHVPIFFIFLVSNIGGSLTPLGDPPLFMGFIKGVPFFWTLRLFPMWAVMVGGVLLMFYLLRRLPVPQGRVPRPHPRPAPRRPPAHDRDDQLPVDRRRHRRHVPALPAPRRRLHPHVRHVPADDQAPVPDRQQVHLQPHPGGGHPLRRHLRHDGARPCSSSTPGRRSSASPSRGSSSGPRAPSRPSSTTRRPTWPSSPWPRASASTAT